MAGVYRGKNRYRASVHRKRWVGTRNPNVVLVVVPSIATASSSGQVLVIAVVSPAATGTASVSAPTINITVVSPTAISTSEIPTPTLVADATLVALPIIATASVSESVLSILSGTPAGEATANAPPPSVEVRIEAPAASSTASAVEPVISIAGTLVTPPGVATASSSDPVVAETLVSPAGLATSSIGSPAIQITIVSPAASSAASASAPVIQADASIVSVPAIANASSSAPVLVGIIVSPASGSTAIVSAPVVIITVVSPPASATASSIAPIVSTGGVTITSPPGTATASIGSPVIKITIVSPSESATASISVPVILADISIVSVPASATASFTAPNIPSLTVVLDDFNRADENPLSLGGLWDTRNTSTALKVVSNQAAGTSVALNSRYWTTKFTSADSKISIDVPTLGATDDYVRLWLRITNPGAAGETGYMMQWGPSDAPGVRIFKETARETFTQIAQDTTKHYVAGDTIAFEAVGTAITVYLNNVPVLTVTDSTYTAAGYVALGARGVNIRLDNFNGTSQGNRVSQEAVEVLAAGQGNARVSQESVEVLNAGQGNARITQESVEVLRNSNVTVSAGVSHVAVEVLYSVTQPTQARLSQLSVEVVHRTQKGLLVSQASVEVIHDAFPTLTGPGNGGETFCVKLAPNGTSVDATLLLAISSASTTLQLTGDSGFPATESFPVIIDSERMIITKIASGIYRVDHRAMAATQRVAHTAGATVTWDDKYYMGVRSTVNIAKDFFWEDDGHLYPGWLLVFDASQGYLGGSRYPMHVEELTGVYPAAGGISKIDGPQPAAEFVPYGVSEECPSSIGTPGLLIDDIVVGDIAVLKYVNPEASAMMLCTRAASIQAWYGFKRVNVFNVDVTFTDPNGIIVDGSVNGTFHDLPFVTVTLPGNDRIYTYGPPRFSNKGWPIAALAVRNGFRRIPKWTSPTWHNFSEVHTGFHEDALFVQVLINRNGIVYGPIPAVDLPHPRDIDGPDATWDDSSFRSSTSWGVYIFEGTYILAGPQFNTADPTATPAPNFIPSVTPPVTPGGAGGGSGADEFIEGGTGGDIGPVPVVNIISLERVRWRAFQTE